MQPSVTEMPFDSESRWHRFHPRVYCHLPVHHILQFTFTSNLNAKFGHSHTKAWAWRVQTVKLQGRWTVVLLHSPKVNSQQQQHMFVYLQTGNLTHQSRHTVLAIKRVGCQLDECAERKYTQYVQYDPTQGLKMRKWHFSLSETVSTDWQYILKRKANAHNTLKQKYRHYFSTSSRPWHALHCLIWICSSHVLTMNSGQTSFFNSMIAISTVLHVFLATHLLPIFRLYTVCLTRLILIHLGKIGTW